MDKVYKMVSSFEVKIVENLNRAVLAEIHNIATNNGIHHKVLLNEKEIVAALLKTVPRKPQGDFEKGEGGCRKSSSRIERTH